MVYFVKLSPPILWAILPKKSKTYMTTVGTAMNPTHEFCLRGRTYLFRLSTLRFLVALARILSSLVYVQAEVYENFLQGASFINY